MAAEEIRTAAMKNMKAGGNNYDDDNNGRKEKRIKKNHYKDAVSEIMEYIKKNEDEDKKLVDLAIKQAEQELEIQDLKKKLLKEKLARLTNDK